MIIVDCRMIENVPNNVDLKVVSFDRLKSEICQIRNVWMCLYLQHGSQKHMNIEHWECLWYRVRRKKINARYNWMNVSMIPSSKSVQNIFSNILLDHLKGQRKGHGSAKNAWRRQRWKLVWFNIQYCWLLIVLTLNGLNVSFIQSIYIIHIILSLYWTHNTVTCSTN